MKEEIKRMILKDIVRPARKDKILFITDTIKKDLAISLFDYFVSKGHLCDLVIMLPTEIDGSEPSEVVALACKKATVILGLTNRSITHTTPLQKAKFGNNAKVVTFPAVTEEMLQRCIFVDYKKMKNLTIKFKTLISNKKNIHITSDAGTDLYLSTEGFEANPQYGEARYGMHMNLPDGECSVGVKDANGILVVDGSMPPRQSTKWGKIGLIKTPIEIGIKKGFAHKISGGQEARVLSNILKAHGNSAYKVAELGMGANPKAKLTGNVTEDEKILGTVHIALGNNTSFGGNNYSKLHLDGVVKSPSLKVGKKILLKNGKVVD